MNEVLRRSMRKAVVTEAATTGGFAPSCVLGSPAPGALRLPEARASATAMYGPRGVWLDRSTIAVADSGNHRVLLWHGWPRGDHRPADVVLGQPDFDSEAPGLLQLPTGIAVTDGRLFVCDAWHHRVLIWNSLPRSNNAMPDVVLGQADLGGIVENRGGPPSRAGMYWPYGLAVVAGNLVIADTGNRRLLVWEGIPSGPELPAAVIGQSHFDAGEENRGEGVGPRSFRWPHAVTTNGRSLVVADAGNHRLMVWEDLASAVAGRDADRVLGQPDMHTAREWPYGPQGRAALRFPYHVVIDGDETFIADTANNRVLLLPDASLPAGCGAEAVLGQRTFQDNGENRWESVDPTTLCWPYGMAVHREGSVTTLAIADSGNNRVVLWQRGMATEGERSTSCV